MVVDGNLSMGVVPGSTAVAIVTGKGAERLPSLPPGPQNMQSEGSNAEPVNYDNGAIVANGMTHFHGRYFKSDDRISLNSARIDAGRIDIGSATTRPNNTPVYVSGDNRSGFLLNDLRGGTAYWNNLGQTTVPPAQTVQLVGTSTKNLGTEIIRVGPGIFDVKTTSSLLDQNGLSVGMQQVVTRFTALSSGKMMVQSTILNYDKNSRLQNSFAASGFLGRQ